nr:hypothetical protein BaRGS_005905 [Batillaria attramentaria]
MLKHLRNTAVYKLLEIFNHSWQDGVLPQIRREAIMIPVLKKGKDRKKAASYCPVSLTSCVVKTLERIVNQRLVWYLQTKNILVPQQAGFRQFHSTEEQTTYLSQEIEDALQKQRLVLAAWIGLQKAFDKTTKPQSIFYNSASYFNSSDMKYGQQKLHYNASSMETENTK